MTKNEMQFFFFGENPIEGWRYYEIDNAGGVSVGTASSYCTGDCYCTEYDGSIILATVGTCSVGVEVTE